MQIKFPKSKVYCVTAKKDYVIIDRIIPPIIKVYYNPVSKKGNLMSYATNTKEKFTDAEIDKYVSEAVEWGKGNIKFLK